MEGQSEAAAPRAQARRREGGPMHLGDLTGLPCMRSCPLILEWLLSSGFSLAGPPAFTAARGTHVL